MYLYIKGLYSSLIQKISNHRLIFLLIVLLLVFAFTLSTVLLIQSRNNIKKTMITYTPDGYEIVLSMKKTEGTIDIYDIGTKRAAASPSVILGNQEFLGDKVQPYVIEVLDKNNRIIVSKKFILGPIMHADDFAQPSLNIHAEFNKTPDRYLSQTLPSYTEATRIILKNPDGKILQSKSYSSPTASKQSIQDVYTYSGSTVVAFIPYGYTATQMSDYKTAVDHSLNKLKTITPWSEAVSADKVSFPIYDSVIEGLSCEQNHDMDSYCQECNWDKAVNALKSKGITATSIVLVGNDPTHGGACAYVGAPYVTIPSAEMKGDMVALIHELGHSVGNLNHEYIEDDYPGKPPDIVNNTAFINCARGKPVTDWKKNYFRY